MSAEARNQGSRPQHAVQVVSRRTGLNPATLRAWERRHGAVEPTRSEGHQRLYSDLDVDRLRLLQRLTASGHRIGRIACLALHDLEDLVAQEVHEGDAAPPLLSSGEDVERLRTELFEAIERLDAATLHRLLERASSSLGVPALLDDLLLPLLETIGRRWKAGELQPVHEHLATAQARALLERILARHPAPHGAPVGVFTTPAGQRHELGALACAVVAAVEGWTPIYLGADSPAEDIAAAARETDARLVALSIVQDDASESFREEVLGIPRLLPRGTLLVAGGVGAGRLAEPLAELGAKTLPNLDGLRDTLRSIARGRKTASGSRDARAEGRR